MRARLTTGAHLPHPGIAVRRGRRVSVRAARPVRLEIDGHPAGRVTGLEVILRPAAYRLLV
jgi:diacylglycerol kinase family enzyme